jgi:hypothetical protein
VEEGLRNDPKPIMLQATQSGTTVSYLFDLPNACGGSSSFQLLAPTYNCATGAITLNTSGGDGSPITFQAPGIRRSTLSSITGTVEEGLRNDPKPIMLQATQSGTTVSYLFDLPNACTSARQGLGELITELGVTVFGNPTIKATAEVEISGAVGQMLHYTVSDARGRFISEDYIEQPGPMEKRTVWLTQQPGLYFLRVSTPTQDQNG